MKKKVSEANKVLEGMCENLNEKLFHGELPPVAITIQQTPKSKGHFTCFQPWCEGEEKYHEINISAATLKDPIEEIVGVMIHEMVHHYCFIKEIKDTSRNGTYHNKNFAAEAEKFGLVVEKHPKYGFGITHPNDTITEYAKSKSWGDELSIYREPDPQKIEPKKSSSRKYVCPECLGSVRATKSVNLICGDCKQVMVNPEEDNNE